MNTPHVGIEETETLGVQACERLLIIRRIGSVLAGHGALADRMAEVARQIRDGCRAALCLVRCLEHEHLDLLACAGAPREQLRSRVPEQWGIPGALVRTMRPLGIEHLASHSLAAASALPIPGAERLCSYAGIPLLTDGRTVGVIELYFSDPTVFDVRGALDFLHLIADICAVAIDRDLLCRQASRQGEEIELQVADRRELQVELLHAQKLESVGRLASEVAHDFNNMLTAMIGFNSLARDELKEDDKVQELLEKVGAACIRTSSLTRQLLAFTRRETIAPSVVKLQPLIRDTAQMVVPLLGPRIEIEIEVLTRADSVFVDTGQMQHMLVNLMVNARDAMSGSGLLKLKLEHKDLDVGSCVLFENLKPGPHLCLEISDTGCGMSEEVRKRIFEPFFTTKVQGKGTGLGLAACASAILQNHGDIEVESAPGQGTTFRILLPYASPRTDSPEPILDEHHAAEGWESVLFVDNECWLRDSAAEGLRRYGYLVYAADSGREAIEAALARRGEYSLLVTETMLRDMSGGELAMRMHQRYPHIRTLFISGCGEPAFLDGESAGVHATWLQKPYSPEQLAERVREALDSDA